MKLLVNVGVQELGATELLAQLREGKGELHALGVQQLREGKGELHALGVHPRVVDVARTWHGGRCAQQPVHHRTSTTQGNPLGLCLWVLKGDARLHQRDLGQRRPSLSGPSSWCRRRS